MFCLYNTLPSFSYGIAMTISLHNVFETSLYFEIDKMEIDTNMTALTGNLHLRYPRGIICSIFYGSRHLSLSNNNKTHIYP